MLKQAFNYRKSSDLRVEKYSPGSAATPDSKNSKSKKMNSKTLRTPDEYSSSNKKSELPPGSSLRQSRSPLMEI